MTVRVLHEDPRILAVDDFLPAHEIAEIERLGVPLLQVRSFLEFVAADAGWLVRVRGGMVAGRYIRYTVGLVVGRGNIAGAGRVVSDG